ncbi:MAG: tetratricopeptide repeat protein [Muribaculaceae bacterium]
MNYKSLIALVLAGSAFSALAQTHAEGVEYYEAGQLSNAKELLQRNINNAGTDKAVGYYYQGLISLSDNNADEARAFFNKGVEANPEYAFNYIGLGQLDLIANNPKEAEANFKKAEGLDKKDPAVQIAIARAYNAVNPELYAKVITKRVDKARKIDMKDPSIYIFEGDILAQAKDYGAAGAKYEMALNYDPNATAAYFKYANLFSQVNPEYGINMLQKLLDLNPDSALGQRSLANAYYNQGMYKEAAAEYGKYVNNPNHFKQDEDRYAFLLFYGGDYQKGYDYASQLLSKDPSNFSALRFQFMNAAQLPAMADQMLPMAEALYNAHMAAPAKNVFAPIDYTLIGDEFQKAQKLDEAKAVLEEGIKNLPTNAALYKQLSMLNVDRRDMPGASNAYDGYIANTKDPGFNDNWQAAVFAYYAGVQNKENDPAAADTFFQKALKFGDAAAEQYPGMYRPAKLKGDVAMQKGQNEEAIQYYIQSIDLLEKMDDTSRFAGDAKNLYNAVGNAYLDKKDKETAKRYFNGYLKYDPDNADYRKFVESL